MCLSKRSGGRSSRGTIGTADSGEEDKIVAALRFAQTALRVKCASASDDLSESGKRDEEQVIYLSCMLR